MPKTQSDGFTSETNVQGYDPQQGQQFRADYQAICEKHYGAVWSMAFVRCNRDRHAANDIAQETFLRVLFTRERLERVVSLDKNQCRALLRTMARHLIIDRQKSAAVRHTQPVDPCVLSDTQTSLERQPLDHLENQELGQEICREINAMPERYRFVFVHRIQDEWDYEEIAEQLGCTEVAARKLLHRALKWLRDRLEHHDPGFGRHAS